MTDLSMNAVFANARRFIEGLALLGGGSELIPADHAPQEPVDVFISSPASAYNRNTMRGVLVTMMGFVWRGRGQV